jgi:hypothetical protein
MPQRHARILNARFGNRLVSFPLKVPAFDIYLYWHANAEGDPANAWLRQQLTGAFANIVGMTSASRRANTSPDSGAKSGGSIAKRERRSRISLSHPLQCAISCRRCLARSNSSPFGNRICRLRCASKSKQPQKHHD